MDDAQSGKSNKLEVVNSIVRWRSILTIFEIECLLSFVSVNSQPIILVLIFDVFHMIALNPKFRSWRSRNGFIDVFEGFFDTLYAVNILSAL